MEGTKKERKHSVATFPSLSVPTAGREMPIRIKSHTHTTVVASSAFPMITTSIFLTKGVGI